MSHVSINRKVCVLPTSEERDTDRVLRPSRIVVRGVPASVILSLSLSLVTMTHQYDSSRHVGAEYRHQ